VSCASTVLSRIVQSGLASPGIDEDTAIEEDRRKKGRSGSLQKQIFIYKHILAQKLSPNSYFFEIFACKLH
jgi:hypothetical protein